MGIVLEESVWENISIQDSALTYCHGIDEFYEQVVVGMHVENMKDDETVNLFRERIMEELTRAGIAVEYKDIGWCVDGGRDG